MVIFNKSCIFLLNLFLLSLSIQKFFLFPCWKLKKILQRKHNVRTTVLESFLLLAPSGGYSLETETQSLAPKKLRVCLRSLWSRRSLSVSSSSAQVLFSFLLQATCLAVDCPLATPAKACRPPAPSRLFKHFSSSSGGKLVAGTRAQCRLLSVSLDIAHTPRWQLNRIFRWFSPWL